MLRERKGKESYQTPRLCHLSNTIQYVHTTLSVRCTRPLCINLQPLQRHSSSQVRHTCELAVIDAHQSKTLDRIFTCSIPFPLILITTQNPRFVFCNMDLELVKMGFDFTRKRRKWVLLSAVLGFTGVGVYRVYHSPSMVKKREKMLKLLGALISVAEAVSESAEAIGVVSKDLNEFVQSDSDKIPNSVRQISKIAGSQELSQSVIGVTRALTVGILRGYTSEARKDAGMGVSSSFPDRVLDKLFSTAGTGFASVVVGSFARNLVMAFYSEAACSGGLNAKSSTSPEENDPEANTAPEWVNVICNDKFRELMGDCIQVFVSTAVSVFLEKTMHINPYDELFSGLTNPKHERKMKEVLASICNGAVETLVRTSNQVLTSANSNDNSNPGYSYLAIDDFGSQTNTVDGEILWQDQQSTGLEAAGKSLDEDEDSGWGDKISSTLAVPSNRKFVLDVAGRVTFETVRSFLEFLLEKLYDGTRSSLNAVREAIVDRGLGIVRYVTEKSSTIATIWISLCLHILGGVWILVP